ncbi:hypothetical protein CTAYLR_006158 [Chrysophaeum taylorii]|uniref:C2H2-type domain-containing protein n=1 Tax=Chrysophaeum taylorii TaxID=2483200 RepID=A0AAD7UPU4_9STRA|nr:hypothetical protein CTAYLR_006158 [Chrysophaeum taylorii]
MPKAEVGTPKWISTQWKKKGLNKLRWYCGLCQVSCRDANGFQLHLAHENHLRREAEAAERGAVRDTAARYLADEYSEAFERSYLRYLVQHKLGQRVRAHEAYKSINPDDRQHDVMKKTCWGTLGRFIADLRERGEVDAWRDDDGWIVTVWEGCPACAWASLPDREAKKIQSRLDQQDAPLGWGDVGRLSRKRGSKDDDTEEAFDRAAKTAEDDYGESQPLPEDRAVVFVRPGGATSSSKRRRGFFLPKKESSSTTTWLRAGLVVRARAGPSFAGGRFDDVKCVVRRVQDRRCLVARLDDETGEETADLEESRLETVLPAIGKPVRVVAGPHAGALATLEAVHLDDFNATVRLLLPEGESSVLLPYEAICKEKGPLNILS